ncbi:MAG TPA: hypothetical protein VFW78_04670 [Bacteroidia bacterium]|nr:hypothetical protein [Bacteroidia bacterium]
MLQNIPRIPCSCPEEHDKAENPLSSEPSAIIPEGQEIVKKEVFIIVDITSRKIKSFTYCYKSAVSEINKTNEQKTSKKIKSTLLHCKNTNPLY